MRKQHRPSRVSRAFYFRTAWLLLSLGLAAVVWWSPVPGVRLDAAPPLPEDSASLKIEAPSTALAGEEFEISISLGEGQSGTVRVECDSDALAEVPEAQVLPAKGKRYRRIPVVLKTTGIHRLKVSLLQNAAVHRLSNPIEVVGEKPAYKVFWGELHAHTLGNHMTFSAYDDLIGRYREDLDRAYEYAREVERLDFCALTNHYQDLGGLMALDRDVEVSPWDLTRQAVIDNHKRGKFVTLLAYEWQGTEGDHNIFYKDDQGRINPFNRVRFVLNDLEKTEALIVPHQVSLPTRWVFHIPEVQRHVEISNRGRSAELKMALPGLARGYQVGFIGASDDHTSHPGINSITAVLAKELTRDAIWEALKARRCYATNGEKILLDVKVDGHLPGESYVASSAPRVEVRVEGTDRIREVHVVRNGETIHIHKGQSWQETFSFLDRDFTRSAMPRNYYHVRVIQGDGEIVKKLSQARFVANNPYEEGADWAWSSPVWVDVHEKLLREWAGGALAQDEAGEVADTLAAVAGSYQKARVNPERNHASQSFLSFHESLLGDPAILAAIYRDGGNVYLGDHFNTLEQTPKWVPEGVLDATPQTLPAITKQLRVQYDSEPLRQRLAALRRSLRKNETDNGILAQTEAAIHYLDFCRRYLVGLTLYHLARNSWLRSLAKLSEISEWMQSARKSIEGAAESYQQWHLLYDAHHADEVPFNFLGNSHLKEDGKALIEDAFESLAELQKRPTSQLLGMGEVFDGDSSSGGLWLQSSRSSDDRDSPGGHGWLLPEGGSADFHVDETYVASIGQLTARHHELIAGLKKRHGMAFPVDYDSHRTADVYIRVVYESAGQGSLVLEYTGIGGMTLRQKAPTPLEGDGRKTQVFHLVDGDFASVRPAATHFRLSAIESPLVLHSVHFYSPMATRTQPIGRATDFTIEKSSSQEVRVRFRLDRPADFNLGVFRRDGRLATVLAEGIQPPGVHEYSWNTDKADPGQYEVKLQVGFAGLEFLGKLDTPPEHLSSPQPSGEKRNNYPVSDAFGNTFHLLPSHTRALNFDVVYFVELKDRRGNRVSGFTIPAKAKAIGDDPWYVLPGNRNWLSFDGGGNLIVSAADQTWPKDNPVYIFSKEEFTSWKPRYAQSLVKALPLDE